MQLARTPKILALLLLPLAVCSMKLKLLANVRNMLMGVPSPYCDDGKTNLTVDWKMSKRNFTCFEDEPFPVLDLEPVQECFDFSNVKFKHKCMGVKLEYDHTEPVFGDHRPLWAVYGEYTFLPPQRWIHNLEHGGIVMLYHPCANGEEVEKLRQIASSCNSRHVITAHNLLSRERPLAVLTHGCRFYMSRVHQDKTVEFIRANTMKAPESDEDREGQFKVMLKNAALDQTAKRVLHDDLEWCPGY